MTDQQFSASRRELLLGMSTVGVASVGAGIGSYAAFNDTEETVSVVTAGAIDLAVHHEAVYNGQPTDLVTAGTIDGKPAALFELPDVKPGDSGRSRFCFELETNPAYLWFCGELLENAEMGRTDPERAVDATGGDPGVGNGELADAVDVELAYGDLSGNTATTITAGTLREVLTRLSTGIPLDGSGRAGVPTPGTQQAFEPTTGGEKTSDPCLVFDWHIDESVGNEIQTDAVEFGLTVHAQQARHADGTENPCDDSGGDGNGDSDRTAISFVAFCVTEGEIDAGDVTDITITETKDGGEPLAVSWDTAIAVDHVVLKTGGGPLAIENFPGGTSGTATVGDGTARQSGQNPSTPCPDGNAVKFEFTGTEFVPE